MMQHSEPVTITPEQARWRARDVHYWRGSPEALAKLVPKFDRRPFSLPSSDGVENPLLDVIVRLPMTPFERELPIGTVSKAYQLLQHHDVLRLSFEALLACSIDPDECTTDLGLSQYGEYMHVRVQLPPAFQYIPPDGKPLRLTFECYNTVEGSARLAVESSWFRLVCSNGLVVRENLVSFKDTHDQHLDVEQFAAALQAGIDRGVSEQKTIARWAATSVREDALVGWVDEVVAKRWGVQRAARVLHVCRTGHDAEFPEPFARGTASQKPVANGALVPGATCPAGNLYDVAQALAWVARTLRDPDERRTLRDGIAPLITELASDAA